MAVTFGKIYLLNNGLSLIRYQLTIKVTSFENQKSRSTDTFDAFFDYVADSVIYLCLVAILWGLTNPFMKKGARGLENVEASSAYGQLIKEIVFLATNLKVCYIIVSLITI